MNKPNLSIIKRVLGHAIKELKNKKEITLRSYALLQTEKIIKKFNQI